MRLTLRISKETKEQIACLVQADGDMHRALQSRCIEWGLREAFRFIEAGNIDIFYLKDDSETAGNCNICISVDKNTVEKFIQLCRDNRRQYKCLGHKVAQWAATTAVKEWQRTKSVLSFYRLEIINN